MKKHLILFVLLIGGIALAEGVGRTVEQDLGLPDKAESRLSFHLVGEDKSLAIVWDGKLVEGKRLNRICMKLNEIADELSK